MTDIDTKALALRVADWLDRFSAGTTEICDLAPAEARALAAFLREAVAVPAGWKLVPTEPTPEMIDAWHRASWPTGPSVSPLSQQGLAFVRYYDAMLAASPVSPPADSGEARLREKADDLKGEDPNECYDLGRRDGFEDAVQEIDVKTGGDGEYRWSDIPERSTPNPAAMIERIVARFKALASTPAPQPGGAVKVQHECVCGHRWMAPMYPDQNCPACSPFVPPQAQDFAKGAEAMREKAAAVADRLFVGRACIGGDPNDDSDTSSEYADDVAETIRALPLPTPAGDAFPQTKRRDGQEPCGECHIKPGETCDICGAARPAGGPV